MAEEEFIKIVIDLPDAEDGVGGEGVWSVKVGEDLYEIRNSPWHALNFNFGDVVRAIAPSEDKHPVVQELVKRGGNRTVQVLFFDAKSEHKEEVFRELKELGASYENNNGSRYAIDMGFEVDFNSVVAYLAECEAKDWLEHWYPAQPQPKGTHDIVH